MGFDTTTVQLAVCLDPLPDGVPVVIRHRLPPVVPSAKQLVDDVLRRLQTIVFELFPAWLPDAGAIDSTSD